MSSSTLQAASQRKTLVQQWDEGVQSQNRDAHPPPSVTEGTKLPQPLEWSQMPQVTTQGAQCSLHTPWEGSLSFTRHISAVSDNYALN